MSCPLVPRCVSRAARAFGLVQTGRRRRESGDSAATPRVAVRRPACLVAHLLCFAVRCLGCQFVGGRRANTRWLAEWLLRAFPACRCLPMIPEPRLTLRSFVRSAWRRSKRLRFRSTAAQGSTRSAPIPGMYVALRFRRVARHGVKTTNSWLSSRPASACLHARRPLMESVAG